MTDTLSEPTDLVEVRTSQRRWRWVRRALWVVGVVAVAVGAVWVVWRSPLLAVDQIGVRGSTAMPAEQLRAAAGVRLGTPLAAVDTEAVAERIRALPRVASVEVRRGFPHELVLVVQDRVPLAVQSAGGRWRIVDVTGHEIDSVRVKPPTLPILKPGEGQLAALAAIDAMPAELRLKVQSVSATTRDDVEFTMVTGQRVRWGDASRAERKATVLAVLLTRPGHVFDVSAPDLPTVRD